MWYQYVCFERSLKLEPERKKSNNSVSYQTALEIFPIKLRRRIAFSQAVSLHWLGGIIKNHSGRTHLHDGFTQQNRWSVTICSQEVGGGSINVVYTWGPANSLCFANIPNMRFLHLSPRKRYADASKKSTSNTILTHNPPNPPGKCKTIIQSLHPGSCVCVCRFTCMFAYCRSERMPRPSTGRGDEQLMMQPVIVLGRRHYWCYV